MIFLCECLDHPNLTLTKVNFSAYRDELTNGNAMRTGHVTQRTLRIHKTKVSIVLENIQSHSMWMTNMIFHENFFQTILILKGGNNYFIFFDVMKVFLKPKFQQWNEKNLSKYISSRLSNLQRFSAYWDNFRISMSKLCLETKIYKKSLTL